MENQRINHLYFNKQRLMAKFNILLLTILVLNSIGAYACSCVNRGLTENFQQSEFVAKAKIIKITPDPKNEMYHDAELELIAVYKGERLKRIKITSELNSSCAFLPAVNSTWIIFAAKWQGVLSFGFCSGGLNFSRTFDPVKYPNGGLHYFKRMALQQQVLEYLSSNKLLNPNPLGLDTFNHELLTIKGFKNKDEIAVFEVDLTTDLSISAIRNVKKFENEALTKAVFDSMKTDVILVKPRNKTTPKPTQMLMFCYFFEKDTGESYVSLF
ncbi:hypothetical protein [Pedobacter psychroterrae]|uniref:Tissue inhibitor of metalloproteinase n=1 Tax=Pedobacter psychroterrae TaxID=2530453 RepID=A0A4R0NKI8_9SPHI|nr:hypothetical protein [Pedobacter psychroterrae]TCD01241.1 hypothetical protein EZ437_10820 [Pedobacter psychroterrae]